MDPFLLSSPFKKKKNSGEAPHEEQIWAKITAKQKNNVCNIIIYSFQAQCLLVISISNKCLLVISTEPENCCTCISLASQVCTCMSLVHLYLQALASGYTTVSSAAYPLQFLSQIIHMPRLDCNQWLAAEELRRDCGPLNSGQAQHEHVLTTF